MVDHISIGLMGLGVVGTGVVSAVQEQSETLSQRIGAPVRVLELAVLDWLRSCL